MKTNIGLYLCAILFVATSCQKEEIAPIKKELSKELLGVYVGELNHAYSDYNKIENPIHNTKIFKAQKIKISKAKGLPNTILIEGETAIEITASLDGENLYKEVFIYSTQNCDGTESYKLQFYPEEERIELVYEHNSLCDGENVKQNYYFAGRKN